MKDCFTVKEYASLHGMTEQAVYKKIRSGKLKATERQESGKRKLYVVINEADNKHVSAADTATRTMDPGQDRASAAGDPLDPFLDEVAHQGSAAATRAPDPGQDGTSAAGDPLDPGRVNDRQKNEVAALEKAIEALTAQLAEKDRQIEKLTELLYREQGLQAQSQFLLTATRTPDPGQDGTSAAGDPLDPGNQESKEEEQVKPKKRGFWYWLFN